MNLIKSVIATSILTLISLPVFAVEDSSANTNIKFKELYTSVVNQGVPAPAAKRLLEFLQINAGKTIVVQSKNRKEDKMIEREVTIRNDFAVIVDYSKPSNERRLYYINLENGKVDKHLVAHGKGSGVRTATKFSNIDGSKMSSLGLYLTGNTYWGQHGESMNLHGLEKTNSKASSRDIVIHAANYVSEDYAKAHERIGRSWGCPAVAPGIIKKMLSLKDGAVIYGWHKDLMASTLANPELQEATDKVDEKDEDLPDEEESIRKKLAEKILKPQ